MMDERAAPPRVNRAQPPRGAAAGTTGAAPPPALDTRRIRRRLLALGWPSMLENVMQSALFIVNTALAGRIGAEALAGAGAANMLMFLSLAFFFGLGVGALALTARAHGAGDLAAAHLAGRQALIGGAALSLLPVVVLGLLPEPILRLVGASDAVVETAAPYLAVSVLSLPFQTAVVITGSIMRGSGDTRTPMLGAALMAGLNLVLGAALVSDLVVPGGLGLTGIAIGMTLARLAAAAFMLAAILRSRLRPSIAGSYRIDLDMQRRLWRVSGPAAAESTIHIGGILAFSIIGLQLGAVSFAAQNVVGAIMSIAYMPSLGLGVAAAAAVGQSLGARNPPLARRFGREAAIGGLLASTLVGVVVVLIPRQLLAVFTQDPAVIDVGEPTVRMTGLFMPVVGLATTIPGALRGAGDTRAVLLFSVLALWVVRVPLALALGPWAGLGLMGMWLAAGINYVVMAAVAAWRFASGRWLTIRI